jgi:DNA-binding SARP family transcriptional activator
VDAGRVVTRDTVIARIWDQPPAGADASVYVHISDLRRLFDQINVAEDRTAPATLGRRTGGYLLRVDRDEVDLHRLRRLAAEARDPSCPTSRQVRLLQEALALWQGSALTGLSGDWATRMREGWAQERLDAVVAWARAELLIGDPVAVLVRLPPGRRVPRSGVRGGDVDAGAVGGGSARRSSRPVHPDPSAAGP